MTCVYIYHFHERVCASDHYTGYTNDLPRRHDEHTRGDGNSFATANKRGVAYSLARVFPNAGASLEAYIKRRGASMFCPICIMHATREFHLAEIERSLADEAEA